MTIEIILRKTGNNLEKVLEKTLNHVNGGLVSYRKSVNVGGITPMRAATS
jgi:hypothetical protein